MATYHQQLLAPVGDNASNNDTMVDSLEQLLPVFSRRKSHVRCFAHTTNLVAKRVLRMFEATANELNEEQRELALHAAAKGPRSIPAHQPDDGEDDKGEGKGKQEDDADVDDADADAHAVVTASWTESNVSNVRHALSKVRTYSSPISCSSMSRCQVHV